MREHKKLYFVNWPLVIVVIALLVYGLLMVRSATAGMPGGAGMVRRQGLGILVGLVPLAIAWKLNYRIFRNAFFPLLILDAFLILSPRIPGIGVTAKGATSWILIFGQQFQPSELAKVVTILMLASLIARYRGSIESGWDFVKVAGALIIPFGLILTQPDLGTGLVFLAIGSGMLLIGGLKSRWALLAGAVVVVTVAAILMLDPVMDDRMGRDVLLKDYQVDRLLVFVDETRDPQGAGHNLKQSKIAIGSGELSGKGLGSGTQGNLRFLPEAQTDFIFAVLGEELGFLGAILLLGLYLVLLVIALDIATRSKDLFGSLVVTGIISMWTFQILENIGMTVGLMPITGIPLPFMSFGSSFMVTNMIAVGILLSVWTRRQGV